MTSTVLVSVFCPDQTGLVASITGNLFDLGANLAATTFTALGTGAEFTAVAELPEDVSIDDIQNDLEKIDVLNGAQISITPFTLEPNQGPHGRITHRITVSGGDRPGLIARLCEVFVQFKANIVRMNAERLVSGTQDQYIIRFSVCLDDDKADKCLATIGNTAGELKLDYHWEGA
ncbi:amino acid-binding protein [Terasakiella sp. SH-1]|uniref:glycine cleavage system protein R n=1 Tax=Terasakiella sp. SH-1 TaxID=2560057 RepID=UPI001074919C|nr:amino acid-binding protein [Terasakiella sp. SH-1]